MGCRTCPRRRKRRMRRRLRKAAASSRCRPMRWWRAPVKVNLTLRVLGRRADGLHLIESLIAFGQPCDWLGFTPGETLELEVEGPTAIQSGPPEKNLVLKAARALSREVPNVKLGRLLLEPTSRLVFFQEPERLKGSERRSDRHFACLRSLPSSSIRGLRFRRETYSRRSSQTLPPQPHARIICPPRPRRRTCLRFDRSPKTGTTSKPQLLNERRWWRNF